MTILGFLNYFILQWFFVRLAKVVDDETNTVVKWTIIRAFPLSGYGDRPWRNW